MKELSKKASQRDLFLHFLAMITLYISAISLTTVLFQIINIYIPDVAANSYDYYGGFDPAKRLLRNALSFLIVMFPVCAFSLHLLNKSYKKDTEKQKLHIRKTIIYFTLFIVSFIILFTLVSLVNGFLNGEMTLRFGLKVLSTLLVAGSVFGYYQWDLVQFKEANKDNHSET